MCNLCNLPATFVRGADLSRRLDKGATTATSGKIQRTNPRRAPTARGTGHVTVRSAGLPRAASRDRQRCPHLSYSVAEHERGHSASKVGARSEARAHSTDPNPCAMSGLRRRSRFIPPGELTRRCVSFLLLSARRCVSFLPRRCVSFLLGDVCPFCRPQPICCGLGRHQHDPCLVGSCVAGDHQSIS